MTPGRHLIAKCIEQGLKEQAILFSEEAIKLVDPAVEVVGFEVIEKSFSALGIDYSKVPGKKWYQFFKSNTDTQFLNALRLIKV